MYPAYHQKDKIDAANEASKLSAWVENRYRIFVVLPMTFAALLSALTIYATRGQSIGMVGPGIVGGIIGAIIGLTGAGLIFGINTLKLRRFYKLSSAEGAGAIALDGVTLFNKSTERFIWAGFHALIVVGIVLLSTLIPIPDSDASASESASAGSSAAEVRRVEADGTMHQLQAIDESSSPVLIAIRYSWEYEGQRYEANTFNSSGSTMVESSTFHRMQRDFPVGEAITVWVDPMDPTSGQLYDTSGHDGDAPTIRHTEREIERMTLIRNIVWMIAAAFALWSLTFGFFGWKSLVRERVARN